MMQGSYVADVIAALGSQGKMRLSHWLVVLLTAWAGVYAVRNLPLSAMLLALIVGPSLWGRVAVLGERPFRQAHATAHDRRTGQRPPSTAAKRSRTVAAVWSGGASQTSALKISTST